MSETLFILGIAFGVFGGIALIASVAMFIGFDIPALFKDKSGKLEQRQIEEIRRNSRLATNQRGKVNVFEELERHAKVKRGTGSLVLGATTENPIAPHAPAPMEDGTSILSESDKVINPNFVIEKNIVFVSTDEVI